MILVNKKRPIAFAVVAFGASVGGIIYPIMFRNLIATTRCVYLQQLIVMTTLLTDASFKWTVRSISFVNVFTFIVANLVSV